MYRIGKDEHVMIDRGYAMIQEDEYDFVIRTDTLINIMYTVADLDAETLAAKLNKYLGTEGLVGRDYISELRDYLPNPIKEIAGVVPLVLNGKKAYEYSLDEMLARIEYLFNTANPNMINKLPPKVINSIRIPNVVTPRRPVEETRELLENTLKEAAEKVMREEFKKLNVHINNSISTPVIEKSDSKLSTYLDDYDEDDIFNSDAFDDFDEEDESSSDESNSGVSSTLELMEQSVEKSARLSETFKTSVYEKESQEPVVEEEVLEGEVDEDEDLISTIYNRGGV